MYVCPRDGADYTVAKTSAYLQRCEEREVDVGLVLGGASVCWRDQLPSHQRCHEVRVKCQRYHLHNHITNIKNAIDIEGK